jgi:Anti-sigma-28 factor, FlgM
LGREILNLAARRDDKIIVRSARALIGTTPFGNKLGNRPVARKRQATFPLILPDDRPYDEPGALAAHRIATERSGGDNAMHEHGPEELSGPARGTPAWWRGLSAPQDPAAEGPPAERKKSRKSAKPIRTELVERVRKEIAAGTYDTQEKWEAALDCLLDRLDRDA